MKIVSMNIRGFGGPTKQKALKEMFSSLNPDIILLQETMCDHITALRLFVYMKSGWEFCAIDALGLSGGILSAYNPILIRCKSYNSFVGILLTACFKGLDYVFSIVNCYGPYANRTSYWNSIVAGGIFNYPNLILVVDLNFTISNLEIWGDCARMDHLSLYFAQLLESMHMVDLSPTKIGPT